MKLIYFDDSKKSAFRLKGHCPYCKVLTTFPALNGLSRENMPRNGRAFPPANWIGKIDPDEIIYGACQCDSCYGYIVAAVTRDDYAYRYSGHQPMSYHDENVSEAIPTSIAEDFREAIRCYAANANKACVLMCRRALEASCVEQGADGKKLHLHQKINKLVEEQKITKPLKDMADSIKLIGNVGAHPEKKFFDASGIKKDDAIAALRFMKHYFEHVYVMPKDMAKYNIS